VSGIGRTVYDRNVLDHVQGLVDVCNLKALEDGEYAVGFMEVVMD
jgi:hypothetical protein